MSFDPIRGGSNVSDETVKNAMAKLEADLKAKGLYFPKRENVERERAKPDPIPPVPPSASHPLAGRAITIFTWVFWALLQFGIIAFFMSLDDEHRAGGIVIGSLVALIVTGLLSRLIWWLADLRSGGRLSELDNAERDFLSGPGISRHPSNGPEHVGRRRIGKNPS